MIPAVLDSGQPVRAPAPVGLVACRVFAVCWALLGAGGCALAFYRSTWPYLTPDDPPGPGWISLIVFLAVLFLAEAGGFLVIGAALTGIQIGAARSAARRRGSVDAWSLSPP